MFPDYLSVSFDYVHMHGVVVVPYFVCSIARLKLEVQDQGSGRILDLDGQEGEGAWELDIFHGRHMWIIPNKKLFPGCFLGLGLKSVSGSPYIYYCVGLLTLVSKLNNLCSIHYLTHVQFNSRRNTWGVYTLKIYRSQTRKVRNLTLAEIYSIKKFTSLMCTGQINSILISIFWSNVKQ